MRMWKKGQHKKAHMLGWVWISALPLNALELGVPRYRAVLQGTYRRGMVSKITGKPLVPLIAGVLPSKLRGQARAAAKAAAKQ